MQEVSWSSRQVVVDFGPGDSQPGPIPYDSGWIAFGYWSRPSGDSITVDSTTWVVPSAPASQDGQTVFLWNGIEGSIYLLQPVLQWGQSAAGGGNTWNAGCWFVHIHVQGVSSSLAPVSSGDTLVGEMIMYPDHPDGGPVEYSCRLYRRGVVLTSMTVVGSDELYVGLEVLEAQHINSCGDYPPMDHTAFSAITIRATSGRTPATSWTPDTHATDCGQYAAVVSNANPGGEVDVHYG
jgi:hypothetical protein